MLFCIFRIIFLFFNAAHLFQGLLYDSPSLPSSVSPTHPLPGIHLWIRSDLSRPGTRQQDCPRLLLCPTGCWFPLSPARGQGSRSSRLHPMWQDTFLSLLTSSLIPQTSGLHPLKSWTPASKKFLSMHPPPAICIFIINCPHVLQSTCILRLAKLNFLR